MFVPRDHRLASARTRQRGQRPTERCRKLLSSAKNGDIPKHLLLEHRDVGVKVGAASGVFLGVSMYLYPNFPDSVDFRFADADLAKVGAARPLFDFLHSWNLAMTEVVCGLGCDGEGDILLTTSAPMAMRRFRTPGTYEFHSDKVRVSGRIHVVGEK